MKNLKYKTHSKTAPVANDVMKNGILLGCHQGLTYKEFKIYVQHFSKICKT